MVKAMLAKILMILPGQIVYCDELEEGGVDEEHADKVPHVHGGQVGDDRQLGAELVAGREEVQHRRHSQHHPAAGRKLSGKTSGRAGTAHMDIVFLVLGHLGGIIEFFSDTSDRL